MSDIRYNSWLHRSGTGGVYQDSSGKVGIGSSVPGNALEIYGTSSSVQIEVNGTGRYRGFEIHEGGTRKAYFQHDATDNCALLNTAEADLKFYTGDTQRMQLDGSGRLMIGNTAAANLFSVANRLVVGDGSGSEGMTIYSDSTNDGYIVFADGASDPAYRMGQIIYSHNVNKMQFRTNGNTDRLTIDNAGNTNISGVTTAKSFVPTEGQLSNRNLIINGACNVAQRGTSATVSSNGILTVDRFYTGTGGEDEDVTVAQGTVASGTTPYNLGFRNTYKVTNGNQTSGAGAADYCEIIYHIEAQDMAKSGWNYTSSSSYVTLSFWVKSSVAQNFYGFFLTRDSTNRNYPFETGSLSANTWTKITKTIPGDSNITINNDNGHGVTLELLPFYGTNYTANSSSVNTWMTWAGSEACPDNTSTWWTTNDATFEVTGLQLEVGSVATPFEHRSYSDDLAKCMRYCEMIGKGNGKYFSNSVAYTTDQMYAVIRFKVEKRTTPSLLHTTGTNYYQNWHNNTGTYLNGFSGVSWPNEWASAIYATTAMTAESAGLLGSSNASAQLLFTADL